jgi:hypothetical protein
MRQTAAPIFILAPELKVLNWPVPLEARPAVKILRDHGKEWEQAKMQNLELAFGARLRGAKQDRKFIRIELAPILASNPASPTIVVQARFAHQGLRPTFLTNIGLTSTEIAMIPSFGAFEPDIVLIRTPADDEIEILPSGETIPIKTAHEKCGLDFP